MEHSPDGKAYLAAHGSELKFYESSVNKCSAKFVILSPIVATRHYQRSSDKQNGNVWNDEIVRGPAWVPARSGTSLSPANPRHVVNQGVDSVPMTLGEVHRGIDALAGFRRVLAHNILDDLKVYPRCWRARGDFPVWARISLLKCCRSGRPTRTATSLTRVLVCVSRWTARSRRSRRT